ncbi:MAG: AAA family ATPase [Candidatus Methanomethylicia archaeon]|nr:AAA family ATPase [Candidatus Methanomethylicia archaeon]
MFIREIILENFMSYEYGRIPLNPGLNIICGPNGSGKSSILLGISIALGAQHTERSRRLRDLIRWGSKLSRVSVVIDNSVKNRGRPCPKIRSDTIRISRYLRADGSYWFEVNGVEYNRSEIQEILKAFNFNPDNMLVIMHQNMVEEFAIVSSKDKLRLFEDAVGLTSYREKVMEVKDRLERVLRDEAEVNSLLEKAKANLDFWRSEYEKLKIRNELLICKKNLEIELAWSKVKRKSSSINELKSKIDNLKGRLKILLDSRDKFVSEIKVLEKEIVDVESEKRRIIDLMVEYARVIGRLEVFKGSIDTSNFNDVFSKFSKLKLDFDVVCKRFESLLKVYVDRVSSKAVLDYMIDVLSSEIKSREKDFKSLEDELKSLIIEAEAIGSAPSVIRSFDEVNSDLIIVNARLETLGNISLEAENMYNNFSYAFNDLMEKARILSGNRQMILNELKNRMEVWKKAISNIVSEINLIYREILTNLDADGSIRIVNFDDIDNAGLEIFVGFKGSKPILFDGYSQSGGERTIAILSFLLATQKFIKSPFRAIDEFDVHMDPRNREVIFKNIISSFRDCETQYLAITPSPIIVSGNVNVIFVQNVGGRSEIKVIR